eukprot:COSAG02_NODE_32177_length_520_cov_35.266033_1_plen_38_part_01
MCGNLPPAVLRAKRSGTQTIRGQQELSINVILPYMYDP